MKFTKNRTVIGIICILVSAVVFFGFGPMLIGQATGQAQITRVSHDIPKNTKITDSMLETVNVGAYNMPSDVVQNRADIVGKYSTMEMRPGDYVLRSKLSAQALGADEYLSKLDGKKVAVSVNIKNFANGLSGKLETGDIISLDVVDYGDMKQTVNDGALQYVKLLAATADTGNDNDRSTATKADKNSDASAKQDMPSTLTVLASPEQKQKLEDYNANGTIHAALVYRGDKDAAQKFLALEDSYIAAHADSGGTKNEK